MRLGKFLHDLLTNLVTHILRHLRSRTNFFLSLRRSFVTCTFLLPQGEKFLHSTPMLEIIWRVIIASPRSDNRWWKRPLLWYLIDMILLVNRFCIIKFLTLVQNSGRLLGYRRLPLRSLLRPLIIPWLQLLPFQLFNMRDRVVCLQDQSLISLLIQLIPIVCLQLRLCYI